MNQCDNCANCYFDTIFKRWKCSKGRDPVCQSRKMLTCSYYVNRGARAAKKAMDKLE